MVFVFGDCRLDADRRELRRSGTLVAVEPQVLDLLLLVLRERHRVVTKDDLVAAVWRGRVVSDSTISSRITAARKAIGDTGTAQSWIRTVSRKGVRFVGDVRNEAGSSGSGHGPEDTGGHPAPVAVDGPAAIAVLPFDNFGCDAAQGFLGDGLAEDILTGLARTTSLRVIARNSSFTYRGRAVDVAQVGRDLGVRYLLEGSVRPIGDRLRITAQLIDVGTRAHLWADRYDVAVAGVFEVHDAITDSVIAALAPAISEAERRRAGRRPPHSLDAWGSYQRGMWHLSRATAADEQAAQACFERAIELDPRFAGGYVGLSSVLARAKGTQVREEELAARAVALDGGDAEAHARLALAMLARGAHAQAEASALQALRLSPQLAAGYGALGVVLAYSGRPREGLPALQECLRLDPRGPFLVNRTNQLALAHYLARDYQQAADAARRAATVFPQFPSPWRWGAAALGQLGRREEATAALREARRLSPAEFDFQVRGRPPWFRPVDHAHMLDGLRRAGWDPGDSR